MTYPFNPQKGGASAELTSGAGSLSVTIATNTNSVRVVNYGATNPVYVRFGNSKLETVTATANDAIIRANSEAIFRKNIDDDTMAYLQKTGSTTLQVQTGTGGS